jgi:hypothetical protein
MKVGDRVQIMSLMDKTGGAMTGRIRCVVPALRHPGGDVPSEGIDFEFGKYDCHAIGGGARDEVSYLVQLELPNPFDVHPPPVLPVLIWPKNDSLKVMDEPKTIKYNSKSKKTSKE